MTFAKYTESYVAFLDILGMKDLIEQSETDPHVLASIVNALSATASIEGSSHEQCKRDELGHIAENTFIKMQIHAFSDSIAIFIPTEAGNALRFLLAQIRMIHDMLIRQKCVTRGAVTMGKMYYDPAWSRPISSNPSTAESESLPEGENSFEVWNRERLHPVIAMGPGLVEAHEWESKIAIFPRVILTPRLVKHIEENPQIDRNPFPFASSTPKDAAGGERFVDDDPRLNTLSKFIRKDQDGIDFLDILHPEVIRSINMKQTITQKDGRQIIRNHFESIDITLVKSLCNEKLGKEKLSIRVKQKYHWLRNYYDMVYPTTES